MYCLSLIHAVSQAKCQKSYLLNTLVLQELIINLSLHSRSSKIIIIPTYIEYLHSKSLTNQVAKQTSRSQGLFRWPSNCGSKKPWVRGWSFLCKLVFKNKFFYLVIFIAYISYLANSPPMCDNVIAVLLSLIWTTFCYRIVLFDINGLLTEREVCTVKYQTEVF
jgi:hypothetical protein